MKKTFVGTASLLVPISLLLVAEINGTPADSPIIRTKTGQLQGKTVQFVFPDSTTTTTQVYEFTGIPFTEPPVGQLRFRKTRPVQPWSGVLSATSFANPCTQLSGDERSGEDCLYLNIWVPKARLDAFLNNRPNKKTLAVFVYIHGGSMVFGSAKNPSDNGRYLSGFNDIIVVTIQYRLGSLGFAYLGNDDVPGNMALWDQVEALKWLSENIGVFGGNSQAITIGGESAGAVLISWHLLSKHSRPYFQRAIIQSGSAISIRGKNSPEVALAATNAIFQQVCPESTSFQDKMKCLRTVDASKFPMADQKAAAMTFECILRPVFGTDFLLDDPLELLNSGEFYRIPILTGSTRDEGSLFISMNGYPPVDNLTYDDYNTLMFDRFRQYGGDTRYPNQPNPLLIDVIKTHYWPQINQRKPKGVDVFKAVSDAYGELSFTCPTYVFANRTASHGVGEVFVYTFTHERSDNTLPAYKGVKHADEMAFMFGEPFAPGNENRFTEQERHFSRAMMTYWSNFVKSGIPNVGYDSEIPHTLPQWPVFVSNRCSEQFFELSASTVVGKKSPTVICEFKDRNCLFWYGVVPRLAEKTLSPNQPNSSNKRIRHQDLTILVSVVSVAICSFFSS